MTGEFIPSYSYLLEENERLKAELPRKVKTRMTIELVNAFYNNGPYGWFKKRKQRRDIKKFIDNLWEEYGPKEDYD